MVTKQSVHTFVFFVLAVIAMTVAPMTFSSAATCGIDISCDGVDPKSIVNSWGLNGYQTPWVPAGTTIIDEAGTVDVCPKLWFMGCSDITKTAYYRSAQIETARQLKVLGISLAPFSTYWAQFIR